MLFVLIFRCELFVALTNRDSNSFKSAGTLFGYVDESAETTTSGETEVNMTWDCYAALIIPYIEKFLLRAYLCFRPERNIISANRDWKTFEVAATGTTEFE